MGCTSSSGRVSTEELEHFIEEHAELWAMLSVNLGLTEEHCKEVAYRVAADIAKGGEKQEGRTGNLLTSAEFERFKSHIATPQGNLEFFHRTIFETFDVDNNKVLDRKELDKFLDIYYDSSSIFASDSRLPPKQELRDLIYEIYDKNSDGALDFAELRPIIAGKVKLASVRDSRP